MAIEGLEKCLDEGILVVNPVTLDTLVNSTLKGAPSWLGQLKENDYVLTYKDLKEADYPIAKVNVSFYAVDVTLGKCVQIALYCDGKKWAAVVNPKTSYRYILGMGSKNFLDTEAGSSLLVRLITELPLMTAITEYANLCNSKVEAPMLKQLFKARIDGKF